MTAIDIPAFVSIVAQRLNSVLPDGTRIVADGAEIEFFGLDGSYGRTEFNPNWHSGADLPWRELVGAIEYFLSDVQDSVAHATRGLAWPSAGPGSSDPLPESWARVDGEFVCFGYIGTALEFEPIALSEITL